MADSSTLVAVQMAEGSGHLHGTAGVEGRETRRARGHAQGAPAGLCAGLGDLGEAILQLLTQDSLQRGGTGGCIGSCTGGATGHRTKDCTGAHCGRAP